MIRLLLPVAFCTSLLVACQVSRPESGASPRHDRLPVYEDELVDLPTALPEISRAVPLEAPLPRPRPEQFAIATQALGDDVPPIGGAAVPIERLVGLDFEGTRALLGQPELDEVQAPALVWVYNGQSCVLRIFFYPYVEAKTYRALTYEVKGSEDTAEFRNRCFAGLLRERARRAG